MKPMAFMVLLLCSLAAQARPAGIDAYVAELRRVESATQPVSLEPLFLAADEVQAAVMTLSEGQAWLETLSEPEYAALGQELRGFVLSRGYDIYAQPDPDFLLALAQAHGRPVDQDFFTLYRQYWGKDYIPIFQRQGEMPTPCVRFNEGVIVEAYEQWRGFVRRHPGAYKMFAEQTVTDAEEIVTLGTCACGDAASVEAELKYFLKRFPLTPVADKIRARLVQLREDPDKLPVQCR